MNRVVKRIMTATTLTLLVFLVAGSAATSYGSLPIIGGGAVLALAAVVLIPLLIAPLRRWGSGWKRAVFRGGAWRAGTAWAIAAALAAALASVVFLDFGVMYYRRIPLKLFVSQYTGHVSPKDGSLKAFEVREEILLRPEWMRRHLYEERPPVLTPPMRTVETVARGFIVSEVRYRLPSRFEDTGHGAERQISGRERQMFPLDYSGANINVTVSRLPAGVFYAAANSSSVARNVYFSFETVSWSLADADDAVAFAFVDPPYQALRPILIPLIQITSLPSLLVAVSFGLTAAVVVLVLKPMLTDFVKSTLTSVLRGDDPAKATVDAATIGDEQVPKTPGASGPNPS